MLIEIVLGVVGMILLAEAWRSHRQLAREARRVAAAKPGVERQGSGPRPRVYPSVSVIRPVRGLDQGARDNIAAALDNGYPGKVETIYVFDDDTEPLLPLVREAVAERQADGREVNVKVIYSGQPPAHRTGKLNAMIAGLRAAKGELVAFADSDIRPDKQGLRALVDTLLDDPEAGAAFAPVVVSERPHTVGDAGYALLLNGMYSPSAAGMARRHDDTLPFIMGQFMVLRRAAIADIGGLESAQGQLVDDMYLGARINDAGYNNVVSPRPVPIIQRDLPLSDFVGVYLRWLAFSRTGLPSLSFKVSSWLRGAVFWIGFLLGAASLVFGLWLPAALNLLAAVAVVASINRLHHAIGGGRLPARHLWVAAGLLLAGPLVLAQIMIRREVRWRGRTYRLDASSRLGQRGHDTLSPHRV